MTDLSPGNLRRQLEVTRFERAVEVVESMAEHRALLTIAELKRINNILTGKEDEDPWRQEPVTLQLPSGRSETFSLVSDPRVSTRDKLHRATELCQAGHVIDAAVEIYVGFVLLHAFKDANRRTAVLTAHYFLQRYGAPISGLALHELGLGDVRQIEQVENLRDTIRQMAKFAQKRSTETSVPPAETQKVGTSEGSGSTVIQPDFGRKKT